MYPIIHTTLKILYHNILVHIYSSPHFLMETCMNFVMCIFHFLLILEINRTIKEVNVPPLKPKSVSVSDVNSKRSVYAGIVRNHPDLGVDVVFKDKDMYRNHWDTTTKINKLLSTSCSEYIRRDLRRRMRARSKCQDEPKEGDSVISESVRELYEALQDPETKKQFASEGLEKEDRSQIVRLH